MARVRDLLNPRPVGLGPRSSVPVSKASFDLKRGEKKKSQTGHLSRPPRRATPESRSRR
jgi:hypothetical protein